MLRFAFLKYLTGNMVKTWLIEIRIEAGAQLADLTENQEKANSGLE